jgi:hypothetical protein
MTEAAYDASLSSASTVDLSSELRHAVSTIH